MGVIIFNGVSSEQYGIVVESYPDYETPEKDYELTHVPGRNGDVIIDKGSYKNSNRTYYIAAGSANGNFVNIANNIASWLLPNKGYCRLEDSYEPSYYRIAMYKDSGVITNVLNNAGRISINFYCKPQRFLKSGDIPITISNSLVDSNGTHVLDSDNNMINDSYYPSFPTLFNPTLYTSLPIIKVYGDSGTVTIGSNTISISHIDDYITIDSETQDTYKGSVNCNSHIVLSHDFPVLEPGINNISFTGSISKVEVVPKWWTI